MTVQVGACQAPDRLLMLRDRDKYIAAVCNAAALQARLAPRCSWGLVEGTAAQEAAACRLECWDLVERGEKGVSLTFTSGRTAEST